MKHLESYSLFESSSDIIVYRGEQGDRKDTGAGMFFTDNHDVAMYFADDDPKKVKKYSLHFNNPLVLKSVGQSVSFTDISKRLAKVLDKKDMKSLQDFNNETRSAGLRSYSYDSKTKKQVHIKSKPRVFDDIDVDMLAKWVFANKDYDGIIIEDIEEADDLGITSTTYIAKKKQAAKPIK